MRHVYLRGVGGKQSQPWLDEALIYVKIGIHDSLRFEIAS